MRIDILTLFPAMCEGPMGDSIIGRGRRSGHLDVGMLDLRAFGRGRHRSVDDTPYGGGSGMVMRVDVLDEAIASVRRPDSRVILMDPAGARFTQAVADRLATHSHLVLVCGHYEGVDARVREHLVDEALSIGDYVLTGGELAAMVIADAVGRLVPGVLGNAQSIVHESFRDGMLEAPVYTRPFEHRGWSVPEVLRGGNHAEIEAWRAAQARALTQRVRADLLPADLPPTRPDRSG